MSFQDFIKFLTQRITSYLDTPVQDKKETDNEEKENTVIFGNKWFGMLPFMIKFSRKNN